MKKRLTLILFFVLCVGFFSHAWAENTEAGNARGIIAKVTTKKGPLNLRAKPGSRGRVVAQIPNGTCVLVLEEAQDWSLCSWDGKQGYCNAEYLTFLREASLALLDFRVLKKGDHGEDVLALKTRLRELGFIRSGSVLTNVYNDTLSERVAIFQRQVGMSEDGIASQALQAFVFSERAPRCTQDLPRVRSQVKSEGSGENRVICGCCMGEGCECCDFAGWIYF